MLKKISIIYFSYIFMLVFCSLSGSVDATNFESREAIVNNIGGIAGTINNSTVNVTARDINVYPPSEKKPPKPIRLLASAPELKDNFIESSGEGSDKSYLSELRERFFADNHGTLISQVLAGMGGIGKSTLAMRYVEVSKEQYDLICWINADTEAKMLNNYETLLEALDKSYRKGSYSPDIVYEKVINTFNSIGLSYLLVYDNVSNPDFLKGKKPNISASKHSHILITSRCTLGWNCNVIRINIFEQPEALGYLFQETQLEKNQQNEESSVQIAQILGFLPLALSHAVSYIKTIREFDKEYSFREYLNDFKENISILEQDTIYSPDNKTINYEYLIKTTLEMAGKRISPSAIDILNYCAYLDKDNILPEFFHDLFSESDIRKSFLELMKFSFIKNSSSNSQFSIHSLVQRVIVDNNRDSINVILSKLGNSIVKKIQGMYITDNKSSDKAFIYLLNIPYILENSKNITEFSEETKLFELTGKVLLNMIMNKVDLQKYFDNLKNIGYTQTYDTLAVALSKKLGFYTQ